jgi:hypothetical protein
MSAASKACQQYDWQILHRIDINTGGVLSIKEIAAHCCSEGMAPNQIKALLEALDREGDREREREREMD